MRLGSKVSCLSAVLDPREVTLFHFEIHLKLGSANRITAHLKIAVESRVGLGLSFASWVKF
jgi:hypothetical protein